MQDLLRERLLKLLCARGKVMENLENHTAPQKLYKLHQICKVSPKTLMRTKSFYISAAPSLELKTSCSIVIKVR